MHEEKIQQLLRDLSGSRDLSKLGTYELESHWERLHLLCYLLQDDLEYCKARLARERGRHVAAIWRPKGGTRGRPTCQYVVLEEFRRRMEAGQFATTLRGQAEILLNWLRRTHPDAPRSSRKTVETAIRNEYYAACERVTEVFVRELLKDQERAGVRVSTRDTVDAVLQLMAESKLRLRVSRATIQALVARNSSYPTKRR